MFSIVDKVGALHNALASFRRFKLNMTKIESYIEGGAFSAAMFFSEVEGHPEERSVSLAMEELAFFSSSLTILGTYPADPFRRA